jgi:hypothetical protein
MRLVLVRDQEAGGSNPLAPTTSLESTTSIAGKSREHPESAWYETNRSCIMSAGRERSLFFEFFALQQAVRFTDNPTFERVGTGSGFWKKH